MGTGIAVGSAVTGRASASTSVGATVIAIIAIIGIMAIIGVITATTKAGLKCHGPILAIGPLAFLTVGHRGEARQARDTRGPFACRRAASPAWKPSAPRDESLREFST